MRFDFPFAVFMGLVAVAQLWALPVKAQDASDTQQALLEDVLANPNNVQLAVEYARVAVANGDYEGAIGTLERVRITYPDLIEIKQQLGILYFKIGSNLTAQAYLEDVVAEVGNADPRGQLANQYLAVISERTKPTKWSGAFLTALRVQTNANAAPKESQVMLGGTSVPLDSTVSGRGDVSALWALALHGSYDLAAQGDLLETDIVLSASRFANLSKLDSLSGEVSIGPSFNMKRFGFDQGRLNTYGLVFGNRKDYANHEAGFGFGARLQTNPWTFVSVDSQLEFRRYWYNDTASNSSLSNQAGYSIRADETLSRRISDAFEVSAFWLAEFREAKVDWEQYWQVGMGGGASYSFASPLKFSEFDWLIDGQLGYSYRAFAGADTGLQATESETDHEAWAKTRLSIPLREDIMLSLSGEYRRLWSNNVLAKYDNATSMVSLAKAF
ncbi:MAG: hypothetical protein HWE23_15240 [Rhodobacteraceae bacterium]|nr:hypothetical protein [Paracoccaceae bacterium]